MLQQKKIIPLEKTKQSTALKQRTDATNLEPLMVPLAGPQTVCSAGFHWIFPKNGVLLVNSKNRLNLDAFLNPVVLNLMLHACVGVSEMPPPLLPPMARCEIMFPPSSYGHSYRAGRCIWSCASSGAPCKIVGCVVHSGVVKSGESSSLTHAWFLMWGCALPANTLSGGFLSWHTPGGCVSSHTIFYTSNCRYSKIRT